ncbi:hypothetical protein J2T20_001605 [Paenibacillus wynnii]|nr:hypothetical protein [Paenibacillus wynnii]
MVIDSSYISIYCKDPNLLEDLYNNALNRNFEKLKYVTDDNDTRTKLSVWESNFIESAFEVNSQKSLISDNTIFTHRAILPSVRPGHFEKVDPGGHTRTI